MPGRLAGSYFKSVINSMLMGKVLFPDYKARVDAMTPDQWYDWDEYLKIVNDIADRLGPGVVTNLGVQIVTKARDAFVAQGFDSPDKILIDYEALFTANIRGAPARDVVRTVVFAPGTAVIEAGIAQPAALVEGYLRGIVTMFGRQLVALQSRRVDREPYPVNRFELRWT